MDKKAMNKMAAELKLAATLQEIKRMLDTKSVIQKVHEFSKDTSKINETDISNLVKELQNFDKNLPKLIKELQNIKNIQN